MGIQESGWDPLILVALVSYLHHNLLLTTQDRKVSNFRFKGDVFIFAFYYTSALKIACGATEKSA